MARKLGIQARISAQDKMSGPLRRMGKGVDRFGRKSKRSVRGVGDSFKRLRGLVTGAIAVMGAGKIARSVGDFADMADNVAKTSRQLGIASDTLQELTFAADRQGVSSETLNKSLKAMNNRLGLLRNGQGQLNTLLKGTNPQLLEQLKNAEDSGEAFELLMGAMNETSNAAEKTALAQAAFSSSGRELVRMSEAGADGIAGLRQQARDLGFVLSEDTLGAAEKFQDSMTNLKATGRGLGQIIMSRLVPSITPLVEKITEWVASNKELINQKVDQFIDRVGQTVETVARLWDSGLIPAVLTGVVAFKAVSAAVAAYKAIMVVATAVQMGLNTAMTANPIGLIIAGIAALVAGIVLLIKNWDKVKSALKTVWDLMKQFGNWIAGIFRPIIDGIVDGFGKIADFAGNIVGKIGDFFGGGNGGQEQQAPMSPNASVIESRRTEQYRTTLDVNFNNAPRGTQVQQKGRAPDLNTRLGYAGAGG